jgi:hypothetical protein
MFRSNDSQNLNLNDIDLDINSIKDNDDYEFKNMLDSTLDEKISNIIDMHSKKLKIVDSNFNNEQEKIFNIYKVKRERQIHLIPKNDKDKKHTIKSTDNMIRKIKIYFIKFLVDLTNDFIMKEKRKRNFFLKHITSNIASDVTIEVNSYLKQFTVKEILSLPLKKKYKKLNLIKNYNSVKIENLLNSDLKFGIFFKKNITDMLILFSDKKKREELEFFGIDKAKTLYEILDIKSKIDDDYKEKMINCAMHLFDYFDIKKKRRSQWTKKKSILPIIKEIISKRKKLINEDLYEFEL